MYYDFVSAKVYHKTRKHLSRFRRVPVLVPGSRLEPGEFMEKQGVSLYTPVIVKYRDEKRDASTILEEALG